MKQHLHFFSGQLSRLFQTFGRITSLEKFYVNSILITSEILLQCLQGNGVGLPTMHTLLQVRDQTYLKNLKYMELQNTFIIVMLLTVFKKTFLNW